MPVPFRLAHVLGGLGTASTSGIGITGWQAWEEYNPTGDRLLRRGGYFYGPIKFDENVLNVTQSQSSSIHFFSKGHECFNKFFGISDFTFDQDSTTSDSITIANPSSTGSSDYIGCTIMQLSHGPNDQGFVFMSETTVKNDRVGMVVWAGAKNVKFTNDSTTEQGHAYFRYYVLFLEKPSTNWSIKGGIWWDDYNVTSIGSGVTVKIISPDNSLHKSYNASADSSREQPSERDWKYVRYSGVWSSSGDESSGSRIFEEVKVLSMTNGATECPEMLGVGESLGSESIAGYKSVSYTYSDSDKKWKKRSSSDFSSELAAWYAPFKNRRGKWENLDSYCWTQSKNRNISSDQEKFLKEFCYRQNSK